VPWEAFFRHGVLPEAKRKCRLVGLAIVRSDDIPAKGGAAKQVARYLGKKLFSFGIPVSDASKDRPAFYKQRMARYIDGTAQRRKGLRSTLTSMYYVKYLRNHAVVSFFASAAVAQ